MGLIRRQRYLAFNDLKVGMRVRVTNLKEQKTQIGTIVNVKENYMYQFIDDQPIRGKAMVSNITIRYDRGYSITIYSTTAENYQFVKDL